MKYRKTRDSPLHHSPGDQDDAAAILYRKPNESGLPQTRHLEDEIVKESVNAELADVGFSADLQVLVGENIKMWMVTNKKWKGKAVEDDEALPMLKPTKFQSILQFLGSNEQEFVADFVMRNETKEQKRAVEVSVKGMPKKVKGKKIPNAVRKVVISTKDSYKDFDDDKTREIAGSLCFIMERYPGGLQGPGIGTIRELVRVALKLLLDANKEVGKYYVAVRYYEPTWEIKHGNHVYRIQLFGVDPNTLKTYKKIFELGV
ncbi:hypothetical protein G7Y89_g7896 [Cudoniella acicularis]|uniref:Uncharacterized protein n=1 Tax=Cudoniella acicularis TaxID=354080 RepID=A0A8H4RHM8_9HELO|nr:hypothetical protein G7Y89_g7896 [Cudoniella acicularis]